MTIRIAMWSGPRNLSTAMMRSFGSRSDTFVSDEPFYGAYLKATGDPQPMADQVMASMDCDWHGRGASNDRPVPDWGADLVPEAYGPPHGRADIAMTTLPGLRHAFLIRDPERVIASYAAKRVAVRPDHLGVERQVEFFEREADRLGHAPPVIDSADILHDPPAMLERLCDALEIRWDPAMLRWEPGIRETDGIWASHWYDAVAASTGFGPPDTGRLNLTMTRDGSPTIAGPITSD